MRGRPHSPSEDEPVDPGGETLRHPAVVDVDHAEGDDLRDGDQDAERPDEADANLRRK